MPTIHPTNSLNVAATLNQWLLTSLLGYGTGVSSTASGSGFDVVGNFGLTLTGFRYAVNWPGETLTPPCVSVFHIPVSTVGAYQGNKAESTLGAKRQSGILEVDVWVSRSVVGWNHQAETLSAFVVDAFTRARQVRIKDYATPNSVIDTQFKVDFGDLESDLASAFDTQPDIHRVRHLVRYNWNVRITE